MLTPNKLFTFWLTSVRYFFVPFSAMLWLICVVVFTLNFNIQPLTIHTVIWSASISTILAIVSLRDKFNTKLHYRTTIALALESLLFLIISLCVIGLLLTTDLIDTQLLRYVQNGFSVALPFIILLGIFTALLIGSLRKSRQFETNDINYSVSILILSLIIAVFTIIKVPHFETSFSGLHTMKYNSYVEPAKYMVENSDPTWYQMKYAADPILNPTGKFDSFGHLPLLQWLLASAFFLLPSLSLEFVTRFVMHLVGVSLIISCYLVFTKIFKRSTALLAVFLIALNPVIIFTSFVTVQDSLCIALMFFAINFLLNYFSTNNKKYLVISSLTLGIGIAIKYNLAVFALPIFTMLILRHERDKVVFFRDTTFLTLFSLLPFAISKLSIEPLPSGNLFLLSFLFILTTTASFGVGWLYVKFHDKLSSLIRKSLTNLKYLPFLLVIVAVPLTLVLRAIDLSFLASESLTDSRLILNFDLYKYMLFEQFKQYLTSPLFYLALISLPTLFSVKKKYRDFALILLLSSLLYWVLASKVIFFHNYYTIIILISLLTALSLLPLIFKNKYYSVSVTLLLVFCTYIGQSETTRLLSSERTNFAQASAYLTENTSPEDMYADESFTLSLTLSTGRSRLGEISAIDKPEVRKSIKDQGFGTTLNNLGIKYLITEYSSPDYLRWAALFSDTPMQPSDYRRTDRIYSKLYPEYVFLYDEKERYTLIDRYDIKNKFQLEKNVGGYKFYTFKD